MVWIAVSFIYNLIKGHYLMCLTRFTLDIHIATCRNYSENGSPNEGWLFPRTEDYFGFCQQASLKDSDNTSHGTCTNYCKGFCSCAFQYFNHVIFAVLGKSNFSTQLFKRLLPPFLCLPIGFPGEHEHEH